MDKEIKRHLVVLAKELKWISQHIMEVAESLGGTDDVLEEEQPKNQLRMFEDE